MSITFDRRAVLAGMASLGIAGSAAAQATWPTKTVRIIVASTPGSSPDTLARMLAKELEPIFGQSVIVENKAGAGGVLGIETLAKSDPDGHTIGIGHDGTMAINTVAYKSLPYSPTKDFAAIAPMAVNEFVLMASAKSGLRTVNDFIAHMKSKGGSATYASAGVGTPNHVFMELLLGRIGAKATHVPYRGGAAAVNDIGGGHVEVMLAGLAPALPMINSGNAVAIAVSQAERSKLLPNVPTLAESIPGFALETWFGLFAPAGTPAGVVDRIGNEVRGILGRANFAEQLNKQGMLVKTGSGDTLAKMVRDDIARYVELAKTVKLDAN